MTRNRSRRLTLTLSMVVAMRATIAGGRVRIAVEAKSLILDVTAARADIRVKLSRL